jgi:hypothetical protein
VFQSSQVLTSVQFSTGTPNTTAQAYPVEWPVRAVASAVYYAQARTCVCFRSVNDEPFSNLPNVLLSSPHTHHPAHRQTRLACSIRIGASTTHGLRMLLPCCLSSRTPLSLTARVLVAPLLLLTYGALPMQDSTHPFLLTLLEVLVWVLVSLTIAT